MPRVFDCTLVHTFCILVHFTDILMPNSQNRWARRVEHWYVNFGLRFFYCIKPTNSQTCQVLPTCVSWFYKMPKYLVYFSPLYWTAANIMAYSWNQVDKLVVNWYIAIELRLPSDIQICQVWPFNRLVRSFSSRCMRHYRDDVTLDIVKSTQRLRPRWVLCSPRI